MVLRGLLFLASFLFVACIEQTNLTSTGATGGFGNVPGNMISNLRILPSQFELTNGQQATAQVIGSVGGAEVRDFEFTASIGPNSTIATIIQITGNVILLKAENPGNTALRVVAGDAEVEANIRVVKAD